MKKLTFLPAIFFISLFAFELNAQQYTGVGYAEGVVGQNYKMPGLLITSESESMFDTPGVITGTYFDCATASGPNFAADTAVTFGINPNGTPKDAGGMDIRSYNTKPDDETAKLYTPVRWNGGSLQWRQGGIWARYTIDFEKGKFNFVYRGNNAGFAIVYHKFTLKIFKPEDMSTVIFEEFIDLSGGLPEEGAIANNVLGIGGGMDQSDWYKLLSDITLDAGTYVIELSSPDDATYTHASWSVFTFNKSDKYAGTPFNDVAYAAGTDTVITWKYDKVESGTQFSGTDSSVTVGLYDDATTTTLGENMRQYTDNPAYASLRWDTGKNRFVSSGAWYNYTHSFAGRTPYYFTFKGHPDFVSTEQNASVKIIQAQGNTLIKELALNNAVEFISNVDEGEASRWMYVPNALNLPEGEFLVQIHVPATDTDITIGEFVFAKENPTNSIPKVITWDWPQSVADNDSLHSNLYTVKLMQNDSEYNLFMHKSIPDLRASTYPDDNGGNGVWSPLEDRSFTFGQFDYTGEIIVEATKVFGTVADRVEIQPKAYGINPFFFDGRTVKFKLKHTENMPSYISINFVSDDNKDYVEEDQHTAVKHGLMIFGDKPEVYKPDTTQAGVVFYSSDLDSATVVNADVLYFKAGDYNLKDVFPLGKIDLVKNDVQIYAEGGAYIRGSIWSEGYDNIWLYGRGIFTGWDLLFHELRNPDALPGEKSKEAFMKFIGSDNCHIEGITFVDPCHHTIPTGNNTYFKNDKIIGWAYNMDGIRAGNGTYVEEMFFKTQDDRDYADRQHTLKNSVMWPMRNGAFGMLGWQSGDGGSAIYENLYFVNSEWARNEETVGNHGVIGSKLKQGANLKNDTIRNIYLEDYTTILTVLRLDYDASLAFDANDPGEIRDFLFENIKVENPFITSGGKQHYQRIEGFEHDGVKATVHDITFRNLIVAGELILDFNKDKYFKIDKNTTHNIFFEAQGDVHTIKTQNNKGGNIYPNGNIAVPNGTNQYVSIEPNTGFRIKDVKVDYTSVGPLSVITLNNITSDHKIEVEFEAGDNTINLTQLIDPNTVLTDTINFGINHLAPDTTTTANQIKAINELKVYPNPAKYQLSIAGIQHHSVVFIYNMDGKIILKTQEKIIDVSFLNPGIYFIRSENKAVKVIIE